MKSTFLFLILFQPLCLVACLYLVYCGLYSTIFHLLPKLWILTVSLLIYIIGTIVILLYLDFIHCPKSNPNFRLIT